MALVEVGIWHVLSACVERAFGRKEMRRYAKRFEKGNKKG